jgi:peptide/nickel transport system permease protein
MSRGRRVLAALAAIVLVVTIAFFVIELAPGDAAATQLGVRGSEAERTALRTALGLDGGIFARFFQYLAHALRGDLGRSYADGRPVLAKIGERLPLSFALACIALALTWLIAIPLSLLRARNTRRALDVIFAFAYALPLPAVALALVAMGAPYGASVGSLVLAASCLLPLLVPRTYAELARALDETLAGDELRTLRAIGAAPAHVLRAALRGQALRLVTLASLQLPVLLSGAAIVEAVFGVPGIGLLAFDALAGRDHPVQLGLVLVSGVIVVVVNLAVDLAAPLFDPRLRVTAERRS